MSNALTVNNTGSSSLFFFFFFGFGDHQELLEDCFSVFHPPPSARDQQNVL